MKKPAEFKIDRESVFFDGIDHQYFFLKKITLDGASRIVVAGECNTILSKTETKDFINWVHENFPKGE